MMATRVLSVAGCPLTPDMVSADAWIAVSILGVLAEGPARCDDVEGCVGLDALTVLPILAILEDDGLVRREPNGFYQLSAPAAAISIAAIVRAIDGDTLWNAAMRGDDAPGIAEIERRIAAGTANILDNFSLAEAIGSQGSQCDVSRF